MKKIKKYLLVTSFFAIIAIIFFPTKYIVKERGWPSHGNPRREVVIKESEYKLEEVSAPDKLATGLGGRKSLCNQCGMLFIFTEADRHSFWMKDMLIPLDIFWMHGKNIVHIEKNIPADRKDIMNPDVISDKVIELAGGTADEKGITVGMGVIFQKSEIFPWKKIIQSLNSNN